MERILFFLISLISIEHLFAQNLVPNYSFENYTSCPTFASQLNLASPWFNATAGTPEYFNSCASISTYCSVPLNFSGFQYAKNGQGYAGIYVFRSDVPNMREYIEIPLTLSLTSNQCYYFEMYVNRPNDFQYACDGIGAYFSAGSITSSNGNVFPYNPQVSNPSGNIISDTMNWTLISGYFTAQGGETFITIGNFKSDANTNYLNVFPNAPGQNQSYLLIDDVKLIPVTYLKPNFGKDTLLCEGDSKLLDVTISGATYLWQDGTTNPTFKVTQKGMYWVNTYMGNCSRSDTIFINYQECCPVFIPNVFTPNNDIENDYFSIQCDCHFNTFKLKIIDRWGKEIYNSINETDKWDGTYMGVKCSAGVYFWVLDYSDDQSKKTQTRTGSISLIR